MCLPVLSWAHLSKSTGKSWMTRFIWNSAWPQKQRFDCLPCLYPSSNINTAYCFWLHCYKFWTTLSSSKSLGLPHSIWKILVFESVTTSVSGSAPELEAIRRHRVDLRVQRTAGRLNVTHLAPTCCEDMCPGFATLESTRAHTHCYSHIVVCQISRDLLTSPLFDLFPLFLLVNMAILRWFAFFLLLQARTFTFSVIAELQLAQAMCVCQGTPGDICIYIHTHIHTYTHTHTHTHTYK